MPKSPESQWRIPDLVDLEYFLALDTEVGEEELNRRDRELYRNRLSGIDSSRQVLLRRWLDLRRETSHTAGAAVLPGAVVAPVLRHLPLLLFILAILAGAGLAWGVLSYSGDLPINLFAALAWLVLLPFIAILFSAALLFRLLQRGNFSAPSAGRLLGALLAWLSRRLLPSGDGGREQNRLALAQCLGILHGRSGLYSTVVAWQIFTLLQLAALGFSSAVLLTVFATGSISDLAFSWQTTAWFSAEGVYRLVTLLAAPWSWLVDPPFSHPSPEQVAGSRVFLKEGLEHLSSAALQAWWYFLLWSILVYTALPRLLLLAAGLWGRRRAWGRLTFLDARSEALLRRLQRPQLHIDKDGEDPPLSPGTGGPSSGAIRGVTRLRALVPQELFSPQRAAEDIQREFNASVEAVHGIKLDEIEDAALFRPLAESDAAVLLILEGWQPCITATLEYLKALRRCLGTDRLLMVALVGRHAEKGWNPAPKSDFRIWRARLAALGDPLLMVYNWGTTGERHIDE